MSPKKAQKTSTGTDLKGWTAIAAFLRITTGTAQRWARDGMPVRREGRFTVADPKELAAWLGREAHMPGAAQIMTNTSDVADALKQSITALGSKRKHRAS
jgi:hypothetical protein